MALDVSMEGFEDIVEVGWGGFATVFRARQPRFNREVALKVLRVRLTRAVLEGFERECAAIGTVSGHPNVVTVHEVGSTAGGHPYIVMEYLHGGSLADRLRFRGPFGWREAGEVGVRLSGALETAHRAGVLHRDVKPENVLVSRYGDPKLGDFGIARLQGGRASANLGPLGSINHAAPEVLSGGPATVASDVYSLASTIFTLLSGTPPHAAPGDDLITVLKRAVAEAPTDLRLRDVPDGICLVLEQALRADPRQRQPTAEEFGRHLASALAGASQSASMSIPLAPKTRPETTTRSKRRWRWIASSAGAAVVIATAVLVATSSTGQPPSAAPTTLAAASGATAQPREQVLMTEDFSANGRGWSVGELSGGSQAVVDGHYRMTITAPLAGSAGLSTRVPLPRVAPAAVRIEADAIGTDPQGRVGVWCDAANGTTAFTGLIQSTGSWQVRVREGGSMTTWLSGTSPAIRTSGVNRIGLTCVRTDAGDRISLTVNDEQLTEGTHNGTAGMRLAVGLTSFASRGDIEVLFDNVVVTAL